MNYYGFSSLFNGIVVLTVGFYLLSRQRQNGLYQSFAVFSACVGLWCIFYSFWQAQTSKAEALMYMRLAMIPCYPIPFAFLWFVLTLVGVKKRCWWLPVVIGTPLVFMIFGFSPFMLADMVPKLNFKFWSVPGALMHFYVFLFCIVVLYSYGVLIQGFKKASGIQKWQIKWVMLSLLPSWVGGATNWFLWYDIPIPPVAHFFIGVGFLILAYAIVRSRLFDVDALADYVQEAKLSALGIMATSINHEVRNPLFVIRGLAETLRDRPDTAPEKIKDIAQRAMAQADRALEIIRNFSEYAKRQSSKTFDKTPLDVREILDSIVPLVASELALDQIRLQVNIPAKTMVCVDRHSLEEIFINLIVNACQAMPNGGEIEITAETGDRGQGTCGPVAHPGLREVQPRVLIKVIDTGPGLAQDQLSRIFEPFYTTKASGTGLGLYVVKQLVGKNGGKISVASIPGKGTTFTITL
ncbi:MAG: ATP-binding protein [Candidatus Omnitrophota bacterium]